MLNRKRMLVGAVIATTAALTVLGTVPAHAAPGRDKPVPPAGSFCPPMRRTTWLPR